ncbi:cytochrome P450 [Panus rudis PR-1116 ss-1]|nr:cytochrome P450 [Panus rudis PR-1116 ss-1]
MRNTMRCITWLVAFLLCNEAALQKLRNEVDTAIDTTFGSMENLQKASPHDLNEKTLPLLHSAVLETLRLAVVAITARPAAQGAAIPLDDGTYVTIKGGTEVIANGYTLNLSESSFDNATAFQIDRFVDGDPEALATLIPPFGLGKHVCKGRDFAMYEMKMFILILLRCFTFTGHTKDGNKIPDGQVPRRSMTALITPALYLKEEFYVRISPRS